MRSSKYRSKYKRLVKKKQSKFINILSMIFIILLLIYFKNFFAKKNLDLDILKVASFKIPDNTLAKINELSVKHKKDFITLVTLYSLENNFFETTSIEEPLEQLEITLINNYNILYKKYKPVIKAYKDIFKTTFEDIKIFPIAELYTDYTYDDSFGVKRDYGGDRIHLGTDIMDNLNTRGRIAIVSMTDGVIQNIGWNELGGYRIGILSKNQNYYYYAHFDSFNKELKNGDKILAGDLLGYMGDTGYSKLEGAKGNFPVHLHIGFSIKTSLTQDEFWINPYPFLKYIKDK